MIKIQEIYEDIENTYMDITEKYINISEHNFQGAMCTHPSTYAFFAGVMAYAKQQVELLGLLADTTYAKIREQRSSAALAKGQKATDKSLDSFIKSQTEFQEAAQAHATAAFKYNLCKNIVSSLDHQKDIIIQLSANKRAEAKLIEQI